MRRIRTVQSTEMRYWNVPGSRSLVAVAVAVSDDETADEAEAVGRGGRRMSHSLWIGKATTMTKTTAQGDEIAISVPSWGRTRRREKGSEGSAAVDRQERGGVAPETETAVWDGAGRGGGGCDGHDRTRPYNDDVAVVFNILSPGRDGGRAEEQQ